MTAAIVKTDGKAIVLNLSTGAELCGVPIAGLGVEAFGDLVNRTMEEAGTSFGFGRWAEPRDLYSNDNFASDDLSESRTIHMGIDVFCQSGTPVCAPHDGIVEHLANNEGELDYGPLVVLRHATGTDGGFFTLYGHLSLETLELLTEGQAVVEGQQIASVGEPPTNGNWPPHLHFQIVKDLMGLDTEFPGVALASEQARWLRLSPSPAAYFPEIESGLLEFSTCN
jgi:murein DD-endopeptidase MepM/ murein hydrolase activator NlpD